MGSKFKKDCIFCKIVKGELPSKKIIETKDLLVYKNIDPKAKIHLLIVPKVHYKNILEAPPGIWSKIREVILQLSDKYKPEGFRISSNINKAAHVQHMHVHFLAPVNVEREV